MKKIIVITLVLLSFLSNAQPVINRSGAGNTVADQRVFDILNLGVPKYQDTTQANLPANIGLDTSGCVFYSYKSKSLWYRQHNPKKWVEFGSGGTALPDGLIYIDSIKATGALQVTCYSSVATPTTWRISSVVYSKSTSNVFNIVAATSGFFRKDIIVANTSNNLVLVQGVESPTAAVQPATPANTVLVTVVDISGSTVSPPTPDLSGYVTLNTAQFISGTKTLALAKINTLQLLDATIGDYGGITLNNDVFSVQKTDGNNLFNIDNSTFKWGVVGSSATLSAISNTNDRVYRLPDSSGTIALLSNITGGGNTIYTGDGRVTSPRAIHWADNAWINDSLPSLIILDKYGNDYFKVVSGGDFSLLGDADSDGVTVDSKLVSERNGQFLIRTTNSASSAFVTRLTVDAERDTSLVDVSQAYFRVNNTHIKSLNAQSQNGDDAQSFIAEGNIAPSLFLSKLNGRANLKYTSIQTHGEYFTIIPQDDTYTGGTALFEAYLSNNNSLAAHQIFIATIDSTTSSPKSARIILDGEKGIGLETSMTGQQGVTYFRNDNVPNLTSQTFQMPALLVDNSTAVASVNGNYADANGNVTVTVPSVDTTLRFGGLKTIYTAYNDSSTIDRNTYKNTFLQNNFQYGYAGYTRGYVFRNPNSGTLTIAQTSTGISATGTAGNYQNYIYSLNNASTEDWVHTVQFKLNSTSNNVILGVGTSNEIAAMVTVSGGNMTVSIRRPSDSTILATSIMSIPASVNGIYTITFKRMGRVASGYLLDNVNGRFSYTQVVLNSLTAATSPVQLIHRLVYPCIWYFNGGYEIQTTNAATINPLYNFVLGGDSVSEGFFAGNADSTYFSLLNNHFKQGLNLSLGGNTSEGMIQSLLNTIKPFESRYFFTCLGINDAFGSVSLAQYTIEQDSIILLNLQRDITPVLLTPTPVSFAPYNATIADYVANYILVRTDFTTFNLWTLVQSGTNLAAAYDGGDGIHPNARANAYFAKTIFDGFQGFIPTAVPLLYSPDYITTTGLRSSLGGSGAVSSVTAANSSLTITPTTGAVTAALNVGNSNTWTANQIFNYSSGDPVKLGGSNNGNIQILVENTSTGTSAQANTRVTNNSGTLAQLGLYGSNHTGYGPIAGNTAYVYGNSPVGLVLMSDNVSGSLIFSTRSGATAAARWQISAAGNFLASVDNTNDWGASGANRVRTGYFGTSVVSPLLSVTGSSSGAASIVAAAAAGTPTLTLPIATGTLVSMTFGTAAPATTPSANGLFFLDTTGKKLYVSTGTASSADWTILN